MLGWGSLFCSLGGCYCIYRNKELSGYAHLQSGHSWCGLGVMINCIGLGLAGGVFLHPDFGMDKTNKTIRAMHKWASRITLIAAWYTAFLGLQQMIPADSVTLAMYAVPLVALIPFTLM
jgi:drug/metabolite transporter (DMT)-like permease